MSRNETEWQNFAEDCDALIKAGNLNSVVAKIKDLTLAAIPRHVRAPIAKLCRRVGLINEGLKLLYPAIRGEAAFEIQPTAEETCEYAVLLSRNGSTEEALALLNGIDGAAHPEAYLYAAICEMALWNYATAVTKLEVYLSSGPNQYGRLIAGINLGASYLGVGRLEEAYRLLTTMIELARAQGAKRLTGNGLELRGQYFYRTGDVARAKQDLEDAAIVFGNSSGYDQLLTLKWGAILDSTVSLDPSPLIQVRQIAVERRHWETVREADLFALKIIFDQKKLDHLYYGSPMVGYRSWLRAQLPFEPSANFILGAANAPLKIDLRWGEIIEQGKVRTIGRKNLRLLRILFRDLYLPRNNGVLFASLYPEEYFNTHSSPLKIRQTLHRFRKWITANHLPLRLQFEPAGYRLTIEETCAVIFEPDGANDHMLTPELTEVEKYFSSWNAFGAADVEAATGLSRSSVQRILNKAVDINLVKKQGKGQATVYKIVTGGARSYLRRIAG